MTLRDSVKRIQSALGTFAKAVEDLRVVGFIDFMHDRAAVRRVPADGANYVERMNYEYGRSSGYQEAVDDLILFKETYLSTQQDQEGLQPDYGGINLALKQGNITQEEADLLRGRSKGKSTATKKKHVNNIAQAMLSEDTPNDYRKPE